MTVERAIVIGILIVILLIVLRVAHPDLRTLMDYTTAQREQMAKDGEARPDGSWPIKTRQDVANAVLDLPRIPAAQQQSAKRWIVQRARAIGAIDVLPKPWGITS